MLVASDAERDQSQVQLWHYRFSRLTYTRHARAMCGQRVHICRSITGSPPVNTLHASVTWQQHQQQQRRRHEAAIAAVIRDSEVECRDNTRLSATSANPRLVECVMLLAVGYLFGSVSLQLLLRSTTQS